MTDGINTPRDRRTSLGAQTEELLGERRGDRALRTSDLGAGVAELILTLLAKARTMPPDGTYGAIQVAGDVWSVLAESIAFDELSDVTMTTPTDGQILRRLAGVWVNSKADVAVAPVAAASQTNIDFTGIPAWADTIHVLFAGLSSNGASQKIIRVGDGAIVATGYTGGTGAIGAANAAGVGDTTGVRLISNLAADTLNGCVTFRRVGTTNQWVASGALGGTSGNIVVVTGSSITLAGALDRVRVTTINGTDTFQSGSVAIRYE